VLPRPGLILGVLALVIAISGFAIAANPTKDGTVTACVKGKDRSLHLASKDNKCSANQRKLKWSQRGPRGLRGPAGANASVTSRQTAPGEVTTTSNADVVLGGGPSVTVQVPAGGAVVMIGANYDAKNESAPNASCSSVYEGPNLVGGVGCVMTAGYTRGHGTATAALDPGPHTFTLRHSTTGGTNASFRNRTLIVSVLK